MKSCSNGPEFNLPALRSINVSNKLNPEIKCQQMPYLSETSSKIHQSFIKPSCSNNNVRVNLILSIVRNCPCEVKVKSENIHSDEQRTGGGTIVKTKLGIHFNGPEARRSRFDETNNIRSKTLKLSAVKSGRFPVGTKNVDLMFSQIPQIQQGGGFLTSTAEMKALNGELLPCCHPFCQTNQNSQHGQSCKNRGEEGSSFSTWRPSVQALLD